MESFAKTIAERSHQPIAACYGCQKCTAGCPTAEDMVYGPDVIVRMVQLGMKDALLRSRAIWLCVGCETCGTRCPNQISVAPIVDVLKEMAIRGGYTPAERPLSVFHREFLRTVLLAGRLHELTMLALYKLLSGDLLSDLDLGARMFLRGKIPILPSRIKGVQQVKELYKKSG